MQSPYNMESVMHILFIFFLTILVRGRDIDRSYQSRLRSGNLTLLPLFYYVKLFDSKLEKAVQIAHKPAHYKNSLR